jgi:hypothetical protein
MARVGFFKRICELLDAGYSREAWQRGKSLENAGSVE